MLPVYRQIQRLEPKQRRATSKILFWFLFAHLEIYTLSAAASTLLLAIGVATVLVLILRSTTIGRRPNLVILNGAIIYCLFLTALEQDSLHLLADGAPLLALLVLEVVHERKAFLFAIAGEHLAGLFFSPWSLLANMKDSPLIAGHATARAFAVVLAVAIALRRHESEPDPERVMALAEPNTHRPLTVAEWEARYGRDHS